MKVKSDPFVPENHPFISYDFLLFKMKRKRNIRGSFLPTKGTKYSPKGTLKKADTGKSLMLELLPHVSAVEFI